MKLSYFELLSPDPVYIQNVGGIVSPKLKDISSVGINTYQSYLSLLLMDLKAYFTAAGDKEQAIRLLQTALNFFIREEVVYSPPSRCFLVQENQKTIGIISKEIYPQICDLICQRNCIKAKREDDLSKAKNKRALQIMEKLRKGRSEIAKQTKADRNIELGNIISAVANKSLSLNILNIWELTVYQLWDCFARLSNNSIYAIQAMSVAVWGNKDNYFDAASWFKRIDTIH